MIARTWHGRVPAAKGDAYETFLRRTGLADIAATPGNRGLMVLRRTIDGETHFVLTSLWDSIEAIQRFAGEDYARARYYDEDDDFLLEREPFVTHYDVILATEFRIQNTEFRQNPREASRVRLPSTAEGMIGIQVQRGDADSADATDTADCSVHRDLPSTGAKSGCFFLREESSPRQERSA
jgi:heme-degrading monooxygenase HmoA